MTALRPLRNRWPGWKDPWCGITMQGTPVGRAFTLLAGGTAGNTAGMGAYGTLCLADGCAATLCGQLTITAGHCSYSTSAPAPALTPALGLLSPYGLHLPTT